MQSRLLISSDEAKRKIQEQIEKGKAIAEMPGSSKVEYQEAKRQNKLWYDYVSELLSRIIDDRQILQSFQHAGDGPRFRVAPPSYSQLKGELDDDIRARQTVLESLLNRLDLLADSVPGRRARSAGPRRRKIPRGEKIFVVHGRDNTAKDSVSGFLARMGYRPVILHEQASEGRTIIEKFEEYSDVSFAVVVMTPDDLCMPRGKKVEPVPQPRQNVVLELGYFLGKLGRRYVCVLHKGGVEIPSDYTGVVYIPMDEGALWQLSLAKELKAAGFDLDMNKL